MVQATIPSELSLYLTTEDPSDAGDIRVIKGAISTLLTCDSSAGWSSLTAGTVSLYELSPYEGTGAIKHSQYRAALADSTAIAKYSNPTTSWDFNGYKYLSVYIKPISNGLSGFKLLFGETTYNEQTSVASSLTIGSYNHKVFDLSSVTSASMNAVTKIAVLCEVSRGSTVLPTAFDIDYITLDPGAGEVKAFDGDRVITLYPKVLHGLYSGSVAGKTVYLSDTSDATVASRKGTPARIDITPSSGSNMCTWMSGMPTGFSLVIGVGTSSSCIKSVTDGSFTVGTNNTVNNNGDLHLFTAFYAD